ncbi:hypothetical protein [Bosea sp. CRIB-10]|uniref:hypothetical protein n=1 Tax=Bosea sp. CRIB-10 TaxID=378404 RepID=UPI0011144D5D|nr:hypothetical protein [Bosea sp. CRIB-10]
MTFLSSLVIGRGCEAAVAAILMKRSRLVVPPDAADHPLHPHAALPAVLRLEPGEPTQGKAFEKPSLMGYECVHPRQSSTEHLVLHRKA